MSTAGDIGKGLAMNPVVGGVVVLAAIGGFVYWKWGDDISDFFENLKDRFNPTSDKNLAYSGVNAIGAAVTGDENFTLGGAIYEATHDEQGGVDLPNLNPFAAAFRFGEDLGSRIASQFDEREATPGTVSSGPTRRYSRGGS